MLDSILGVLCDGQQHFHSRSIDYEMNSEIIRHQIEQGVSEYLKVVRYAADQTKAGSDERLRCFEHCFVVWAGLRFWRQSPLQGIISRRVRKLALELQKELASRM